MIWLLDVPYDSRRDAQWGGARWDPKLRAWTWQGEELPEKLQVFAPRPHSWAAWQQDEVRSRLGDGGWEPATLEPTITARPHQLEAAKMILEAWVQNRPGFLLADDVGVGKTISAISGVTATGEGMNVLVVSPLAVLPHWRRSIDACGAGQNRWCVINYDRLRTLLGESEAERKAVRTRTKNKRRVTSGESLVDWDVIIADESHLLRNPTSQRSAALRRLIASGKEDAFVIWASATAGQNPLELSYLAPLLASVTGDRARDLADFEQWCKLRGIQVRRGAYGSWKWERNEADLDEMRELLFAGEIPAGVRRRPADIAGWPSIERYAFPVELDAGGRALYEAAWEEVQAAWRAEREVQAGKKGSARRENALVALLRFRQKASLARVAATVELVEDLVANGRQVVVSCEFLGSVDAIREALAKARLESVTITGAVGADEREENRLAFQRGDVPVCVFTVTEGISLHAGEEASRASEAERATVIHDLRWSAIATAQIEGRAHRDGQRAPVWLAYGADTVEERVVQVVLERLEDMATMVGDDTTGLEVLASVI